MPRQRTKRGFVERTLTLKEDRVRAAAALDRIKVAERPPTDIAPELVERLGRLVRENVTAAEIPFRKVWLQAIVDRVKVEIGRAHV